MTGCTGTQDAWGRALFPQVLPSPTASPAASAQRWPCSATSCPTSWVSACPPAPSTPSPAPQPCHPPSSCRRRPGGAAAGRHGTAHPPAPQPALGSALLPGGGGGGGRGAERGAPHPMDPHRHRRHLPLRGPGRHGEGAAGEGGSGARPCPSPAEPPLCPQLPEVLRGPGEGTWGHFVLQNAGFLLGSGIMLGIALAEGHVSAWLQP